MTKLRPEKEEALRTRQGQYRELMEKAEKVRVVVCAAICLDYHHLIVGPRHYDAVMLEQIWRQGLDANTHRWQQGFVDQYGIFLTREEAAKIALAAGQITDETIESLQSEDLY